MKRCCLRQSCLIAGLLLAALLVNSAVNVRAQQASPPDVAPGHAATGLFPGAAPLPVVKESLLLDHVRNLTAPVMEGRRAGGAGDRASANYTAEQFRRAGLVPVGDNNTFFQAFAFESWQALPVTGLSRVEGGKVVKSYSCEWLSSFTGRDFRPIPRAGQGSLTAEVVFVGYGLDEPGLGLNDYAGVDVQGKIVLLLLGDGPLPLGRSRTESKLVTARKRGARACLLAYPPYGYPVIDPMSAPLPELTETNGSARLPVFSIRNTLRDELLAPRGAVQPLQAAVTAGKIKSLATGITLQADLRTEYEPAAHSVNVVALLPGTDPSLRDETLVIATYRDGYGVDAEGKLCPGANDNASGLAVLIETARLLAQAKPARSVLFVAYGAEVGRLEHSPSAPGLSHFLAHPSVPLSQMAAVFTIDRVGLNSPDRIAIENVTLFPEIFLHLRSGLPDLSATLVTGSFSPPRAMWPEGVPFYRLTDMAESGTRGSPQRTWLYPTEDIPERLRPDTLRTYTSVLTRAVGYLSTAEIPRLIPPFRGHLEAMYRAVTTDFMPTTRADFYQRAASVRRDYLKDVVTYIPNVEGRKLSRTEKRRRFLEELAELRENLSDLRSRLRPVRGANDLAFELKGGNLAADNQVGVWLGLDALDLLSEESPAVSLAELKANGLQMLVLTDKNARQLATENGSPILAAAQSQGLWVLLGEMDNHHRQKLVQAASRPLLIADAQLSDVDLKAFAEAGHMIVIMPPPAAGAAREKNGKSPDAAYCERVLHVVEVVGKDHVIVSAPPAGPASKLVAELAKQQFSPENVEDLFGTNFVRFYTTVTAEKAP